ncbi:diguanylate cyclase (GGDEF) domain-containing protein [Duganella sp. CF517]|uniref:GGDEF domain-containing response regulator n=1 Tax=Duganella sp. CF517 TaxID=1881038 RepID=UPI0008B6831E|nr:diguanylate cyclase [Duganella sp. CF517]SEO06549.1 diguanylate cyclase (GGDEF) domain-containing protein [Duganella sp. CF517]
MTENPGRSGSVGAYFSSSRDRRAHFQTTCGEMFSRLAIVDSIDDLGVELARQSADLLVLDLNGYARPGGLAAIGHLIIDRAGAPLLVLCGYEQGGWLPELMAFGAFNYLICPVLDDDLRHAIRRTLSVSDNPAAATQQRLFDRERELRDLVGLQRGVQHAIGAIDDIDRMAAKVCHALCGFPGVYHASLLHMKEHGDLRLVAQASPDDLNLATLLGRTDHLMLSPLRDVFPPLMAVSSGRMVLLDAPEKTGDPELAMRLHDRYVRMVLALPLRSDAGNPETESVMGAICLMFDRHIPFSREQFATFASLSQFVSLGLGMSDLKHRNDELSGQLSQLSRVDQLTGAANRRAGETMLDNELRRARRYGLPLAAISFEVSSFRSSSDPYGHPLGDAALRMAAETVMRRLRTSDMLARMRGQEFLIVATHTADHDVMLLAEKLRQAIAEADLPGCGSVNVGLAIAQAGPEDGVDTILDRLDAALQRAKRAGRNHIELAG